MIDLENLFTTMTFGESLLYKKLVGKSTQHFEQSMQEDLFTVLAALLFISERRLNARYTWAEAQEIPISELQDRFNFNDNAEEVKEVVEEDEDFHSPIDDIVIDEDEESLPKDTKKKTKS